MSDEIPDGEVLQSEELIEDCRYCGEPVDVESDTPFKSVSDRFAHADCVADYCYGDRELFATTEGTFEMEAVTIIERTASKEKVCDSYWRARCPMCYTPHETETQEESARTDLLKMITSCCGPVEWLPPADYIEDCDICGDDHRESDGCLPISRRDPFPDAETHRYECTECDWQGSEASDFDNADGRCPECDTTAVRAIQLATDGGDTPGDGTDDGTDGEVLHDRPPFESWFVIGVDVEFERDNPLFASVRGPFPSRERAEHKRDEQQDAWQRALDEWDDGNPYDFKGWQIMRVLLRDFQLEKLEREDRESFEIRREAAGALGASLLADEGIGPLAGDGDD